MAVEAGGRRVNGEIGSCDPSLPDQSHRLFVTYPPPAHLTRMASTCPPGAGE